MTHAVSATYTRFDHMSLTAALLAGLLHALTALALWLAPLLDKKDIEVEPIEVTLEQPSPQAPATPAPQPFPSQPSPPPTPPAASAPAVPATPPPAARVAPPPAQAAPQVPLGLAPSPPAKSETKQPETPKEESRPTETQQASRPPEPPLQSVLPPVETPPPPITSEDFPKPPPKPAEPARPQQQTRTAPAPPPAQNQQRLAPSPLSSHQNPQQATAPSTTFVNPADTYVHTKARDDYLYQVLRKFSQYLPNLQQGQAQEGGSVELSFVIARDGRLIDARVTRSSGVASLDRSLLDAMRAASPYPPLPREILGDRATFFAPLVTRH